MIVEFFIVFFIGMSVGHQYTLWVESMDDNQQEEGLENDVRLRRDCDLSFVSHRENYPLVEPARSSKGQD